MYFIARNNKVYSYIASKKRLHRYVFTVVIFAVFVFMAVCCIYYPLQSYNALLKQERDQLQKKYAEIRCIQEHNKNCEQSIEKAEKTVEQYATRGNNQSTIQEDLSFIIDSVQKVGLHLQSYSVVKVIDKEWYTKEIVHIDVTGTFEQCVSFIEYSKKSKQLISLSQLSIDCNGAVCKMNCDVACVAIKNPSTLSKLKG
jgi:Tfp pilus assembly protein PilO